MKTSLLFIVRSLLTGLATLLLNGCSDPAPVNRDLLFASSRLHSSAPIQAPGAVSSNQNGEDDDPAEASIELTQARAIVRADAVARTDSAPTENGTKFRKLVQTTSYQTLLKNAQAALTEAKAEAATALRELEARTPAERTILAAEAERILMTATVDLENGAASHALEKLARGEAALFFLRNDLVTALPNSSRIPADVFAMVPPPHLEKAKEGLSSCLQRLKTLESVIDDGKSGPLIALLEGKLSKLEEAISSKQRSEFQKESGQLFMKIGKAKWADLAVTRDARVQTKLASLRTELEAATGWRELRLASYRPRGPPDTLALLSIREFDLDPVGWCKAEAELAALGERLRNDLKIPETLRVKGVDPIERIAATLEDSTLGFLDHVGRQMAKTDDVKLPSDFLFAAKHEHIEKWAQATMKERARRQAGGQQIVVEAQHFRTPSVAITARVDAHLVHSAASRFPSRAAMPPKLHQEIQRITKDTVHKYVGLLTSSLQRYADLSRTVALTSVAIAEPAAKAHELGKISLFALASEIDSLLRRAEAGGIDVQVEKKQLLVASALFSRSRREGPESAGSQLEKPFPNGPNGGGSKASSILWTPKDEKIDSFQAGIERLLFDLDSQALKVETALADATRLAANLPKFEAEPIGSRKGRLTVTESALRSAGFDPKTLASDKSQSRLPEKHLDWSGRLNKKSGLPFSYSDAVKNPKTFEAVGGGIHFGETAQYTGKEELSHAVLIYEKGKGLLLRDGRSGTEWIVDSRVDATSLRALYRFAVSGRNAAISIGWGQERESFRELLGSAQTGESPVLLDPFLVDTAVGQDLILADTIPWALDTINYPDGSPVPFRAEFASAKSAYAENARNRLESFLEKMGPIEMKDAKALADKLESAGVPALFLMAFKFDSLDSNSIGWLVDREIESALRKEFGSPTPFPRSGGRWLSISSPRGRLTEKLKQQYAEELRKSVPLLERRQIDEEKLSALAHAEAVEAVEKVVSGIGEKATKFFGKGMIGKRLPLLQELIIESTSDKSTNRPLVEAWAALNLGQGKSRRDVAELLLFFLNATTLAILYDDHVSFTPQDKAVGLKAEMRYRYATTRIEIDSNRVGLGRDATGSEVQTLSDLTELVNPRVPEMMKAFPYLARIERYAALAALFRWSDHAAKEGALGLVDLSGLSAWPANDREGYPTVDVLKR